MILEVLLGRPSSFPKHIATSREWTSDLYNDTLSSSMICHIEARKLNDLRRTLPAFNLQKFDDQCREKNKGLSSLFRSIIDKNSFLYYLNSSLFLSLLIELLSTCKFRQAIVYISSVVADLRNIVTLVTIIQSFFRLLMNQI